MVEPNASDNLHVTTTPQALMDLRHSDPASINTELDREASTCKTTERPALPADSKPTVEDEKK